MRAKKRGGGALVVALVTLAVIMLLSAAVLRSLVAARRQSLQSVKVLQASWLAESALERATARFAADPAYSGETWEVDLASNDEHSATAVVKIEPPSAAEGIRQVRAAAHVAGITVSRTLNLLSE